MCVCWCVYVPLHAVRRQKTKVGLSSLLQSRLGVETEVMRLGIKGVYLTELKLLGLGDAQQSPDLEEERKIRGRKEREKIRKHGDDSAFCGSGYLYLAGIQAVEASDASWQSLWIVEKHDYGGQEKSANRCVKKLRAFCLRVRS